MMEIIFHEQKFSQYSLLTGTRIEVGFTTDVPAVIAAIRCSPELKFINPDANLDGYADPVGTIRPNLHSDGFPTILVFEVKEDYPGAISVTIVLEGGYEKTLELGTDIRAAPFRPNLATDPTISIEMKSERVRFDAGGWQSWSHRQTPRRRVSFNALTSSTDHMSARQIRTILDTPCLYPDFRWAAEVEEYGYDVYARSDYIRTSGDRPVLPSGQDLVFLRSDHVAGSRVVSDDGVRIFLAHPPRLVDGTEVPVPAGSMVLTAGVGVLENGASLSALTRVWGDAKFDVAFLPGRQPSHLMPPPAYRTDGMEVWGFDVDGREPVDLSCDGHLIRVDSGVGIFEVAKQFGGQDHLTASSVMLSAAERTRLEDFFVRHGGRSRPFLYPHPYQGFLDIREITDYENGSVAVTIRRPADPHLEERALGQYIVIKYLDGRTRAMPVIEVNLEERIKVWNHPDSENGSLITGATYIDSPADLRNAGIEWISLASKSFFATDRLDMQMLSPDVFTCRVNIQQEIRDTV